jgi:hypothetical protein
MMCVTPARATAAMLSAVQIPPPTAMRSVSHVMSIPILCRAGSPARPHASTSADTFAPPETLPLVAKSPALVAGEFLGVHSTASFYGIVSCRNLLFITRS